MPDSSLETVEYYPPGWTEHCHDETLIEWVYDDDPTITVRVDGTHEDGYAVEPIAGVNEHGEEVLTKPLRDPVERGLALDVGITLVYAMNGVIGRLEGDPAFTGDQDGA
ncbi:MAG: hypothetical protein U5K37_10000 [Natrialbaceae archaeon]|nr:hypothetical protein [Natrialbaceae archaeon]